MKQKNKKLTQAEKEAILSLIETKDFHFVAFLPYFLSAKDGELTGPTATKILRRLAVTFDEDDPNIQEKLYLTLDKMMDGIAKIKYKQNKNQFRFNDVNQINEYILNTFDKVDEFNQDFYFKNLVNMLIFRIEDKNNYDSFLEEINRLYGLYLAKGILPREETNSFYNEILNKQLDSYIQKEKKQKQEELRHSLPYTKNKQKGIEIRAKLEKFNNLLKTNEYEKLGLSKEELLDTITDYNIYLNSLKRLRKENIQIGNLELTAINNLFIEGKLTEKHLEKVLPTASKQAITTILDKYTQIKRQFLDRVTIDDEELLSLDLPYNYNNYKMATQAQLNQNIISLLENMTETEALDIIESEPLQSGIKFLLSLFSYFEELDTKKMIALLGNYPRILKKMYKEKLIPIEIMTEAMPQFASFLSILDAYTSVDDITIAAIGDDIVGLLSSSDKMTSRNPIDYLKTYEGMLQREYAYIPPVEGEYGKYYYESANDSDRERLLIGKYCDYSCIGPEGAGEIDYYSALNGHMADVIMIKEKETDSFKARSLCFRRGNYVVLAPIHTDRGLAKDLYKPEFLSAIATQMLTKAQESKDSLEYIFISPDMRLLDEFYPIIESKYLEEPFPHADLDIQAYLIGTRKNIEEVNIDPTVPMPVAYYTKREKVKDKEDISTSELTRIKALDILLTEDEEEKENKSRFFEPVSKRKYDEIYKGQDWYIAVSNGQIVEEVVLPTNHRKQKQEIKTLKTALKSLEVNNNEIESSKGGKK